VLDRLRNAPLARATLLAAAFLTLAASIGLHPEPGSGDLVTAHRGLASAHTDEGAHTCLACLTHIAALAPPRAGLSSATTQAWRLDYCEQSLLVGRLAGRDLSGRSPPSSS
jgi:hypothetical protein